MSEETPMPSPVADRYEYWSEPPPVLSDRCLWWLDRLNSRQWSTAELDAELPETCHGYDTSAQLFGVYLWEWSNILWHVVGNRRYWAGRQGKVDQWLTGGSRWPLRRVD